MPYDSVVEKRMTLATVMSRLYTGQYTSVAHWYSDMLMVFNNTFKYWATDPVGAETVAVSDFVCVHVDAGAFVKM